ncbi:hypothetical protein NT2_13_00780 [Caenibius tardaugens NBRC 16725]|uniref:Uncharacterized protein n=2 Tax=Caenibius TaxID=2827482 RepID=U2YBT5_9SPHN|nr:hypothetical protein NT2_13_00780 [Caenibius tardaugens NBRC 16725]
MVIDVTKIGDLTFEVCFDERLRDDLREVSGWGTEEDAVRRILAGVLLGDGQSARFFDDLDGEVPF